MKYREVLEEVQPHYAIAAAVIAAAASAYAASQQAKASNRAKRGGLNAANMQQGGVSPTAPTAQRFAEEDKQRLGDFLGKAGTGASSPATEKEQGFSLGLKSLGDDNVPPPQSMDMSNGAKIDQSAMPITKIEKQPRVEQAQSSGGDAAGQMGGYAQTALQLYQLYKQSQQGPSPQPAAQLGQMNLQPTAMRFGR